MTSNTIIKRTKEEVELEIKKVSKAKADAMKKYCRAENRLGVLEKELQEVAG